MKKVILLILLMDAFYCLRSQNYLISFTGSGESTTVESVELKNISQQSTLTLNGSDTLHLVDAVGINPIIINNENMLIYPNPTKQSCQVEFYNKIAGSACIEIYNVAGKILTRMNLLLTTGTHFFKITGLASGIYLVKVNTPEYIYTQQLISTSGMKTIPSITYEGCSQSTLENNQIKSIKNIVIMQYNEGERLSLKGITGDYSHTVTLVPTESQTINFEFIECRDPDGRNYSVVTAGEQKWMAENLAYITKEYLSLESSITEPRNYVYGYNGTNVSEAKATANFSDYGALYNWDGAMEGCPPGWHLPSDGEWNELSAFIESINPDNVGNQMKSCRQDGSPLGGSCNTFIHPRWNMDSYSGNYGSDDVGLACFPGGRHNGSNVEWMGKGGWWWSSTEQYGSDAYACHLYYQLGTVTNPLNIKSYGFSVRCVQD